MDELTRSPVDLPADFPNRLAATIANWKRKLLDLSRRNRALNFKPTKVSTIAIVDEQPAEETVRDRDRLRQQVLEARGWIVHRVWSTDWFKDRQGQIDRLLQLIAESRQRVKSEEAHAAEEGFIRAQHVAALKSVPAQDEAPARPGYVRPVVPQYEMYSGAAAPIGGDLLQASVNTLAEMVARVVHLEGPVHEADLIARVSNLWERKRVLVFRRRSGPLPASPAGRRQSKDAVRSTGGPTERAGCGLAPRPEFQVTALLPRSSWRRSNSCSPAGMHFNGRV